MSYKYQEKISTLKEQNGLDCYNDYVDRDCPAYRWTFSDIKNAKNFEPTAFDKTNDGARRKCGGYCISLYETEIASQKAWEELVRDKPNKIKKLGTHMAIGKITKDKGKCSKTSKTLHFNFAEYDGVSLVSDFKILKELATDEWMKSLEED